MKYMPSIPKGVYRPVLSFIPGYLAKQTDIIGSIIREDRSFQEGQEPVRERLMNNALERMLGAPGQLIIEGLSIANIVATYSNMYNDPGNIKEKVAFGAALAMRPIAALAMGYLIDKGEKLIRK